MVEQLAEAEIERQGQVTMKHDPSKNENDNDVFYSVVDGELYLQQNGIYNQQYEEKKNKNED